MFVLELNQSEAKDLRAALSIRVASMRQELAHTDSREYRVYVRETLERLEEVLGRLDGILAAGEKA
ncbi:MAG: hypothetical protein IPK82_34140 [Polyangiaceae bacterium]|nr:hypothetical protein [Polyangiaceae bacterium]